MNQDEIIAMAKEAGARSEHWATRLFPAVQFLFTPDDLSRFAALVAAKEREACEKACEEVARKYEEQHRGCYPDGMVPAELGADDCVEAIRARGQKEGV